MASGFLSASFSVKSMKNLTLILVISGLLVGCASYQSKVAESRNLIRQGRITEAADKLEELSAKPSDDQLVYLLDYGTALQIAGKYKESNSILLKADKLTDLNDYHSVSNIVGATLGGEEMIQYKGESFEKYLINTMLALNFLMLDDSDSALVEARRINQKISKMRMDGREAYELSPFAKYLSAMIWEAEKKYDDAYIDFEGAYKLDSSIPGIGADLIRSAKKARRDDAYKKWKKTFPSVEEDPKWYSTKYAEVIIVHQQGWGPEKKPSHDEYRFPRLYPVTSDTVAARVNVDGKLLGTTQAIYSIEQVAIETLNKDYGALAARRVGALAAKAVVADQIRQKNELAGAVAWIAMNLADRADLRQWSTLPQTIQISRLYLEPGVHTLQIQGIDHSNAPTADQAEFKEIKFKAGETRFFNFRSLR